jgi:hypothetical protein
MTDTTAVARTTRPADGGTIVAAALAWRRADIAFQAADALTGEAHDCGDAPVCPIIRAADDAQDRYNVARRELFALCDTWSERAG